MSWNNSSERQRFEKAQREQAKKYKELGMSEEQIRTMYEFDLKQFQSNRRFYSHNVSLEPSQFDDDEDNSAVIIDLDSSGEHGRLWWIEELDDPALTVQVKQLSKSELELLTMYVFEDCSQAELAEVFQIAQQNISKRIKRIKDFLSNRV